MEEATSFVKNRYWVLRHGKSIPNEKGLIVSSLENGVRSEYQLASEGVEQAQLAGQLFLKELKERNIPLESVRICYSPFARTSHTAKVVASVLNLPFEGPPCKVTLFIPSVFSFITWRCASVTSFARKQTIIWLIGHRWSCTLFDLHILTRVRQLEILLMDD